MIRLRNAGTAFILTLFLALALCTTSAFAQSAQMQKSAAIHAAIVAHQRLGGAPLSAYPFAPTVPFAPAMRPVPSLHRTYFAPAMRPVPSLHRTYFAPAMRPVPSLHRAYFAPAMRPVPALHRAYFAPAMRPVPSLHRAYFAPAMRPVPALHATHFFHHGFSHIHSITAHHVHTAARAVAVVRFFSYYGLCDNFPDTDWRFWWFSTHPWLP
jgi:hypothetical protein